MALCLMVGWMRSLAVQDRVCFYRRQAIYAITLMDGEIEWTRHVRPDVDYLPMRWSSKTITEIVRKNSLKSWENCEIHWRRYWYGFDFGAKSYLMGTMKPEGTSSRSIPGEYWKRRVEVWQVPYWSMILPLTLLSAYLLRSKSRKRVPTNVADAVTVKGA